MLTPTISNSYCLYFPSTPCNLPFSIRCSLLDYNITFKVYKHTTIVLLYKISIPRHNVYQMTHYNS